MVWKISILNLLFQFGNLVSFSLALAEFLLNRLQLLTEDILALALADLGLSVAGDFLAQLQYLDFLRKGSIQRSQQLNRGGAFEQLLLVLHGEIEERGYAIGQGDGIVLITEGRCCFLDARGLNQPRKVSH